MSIKSTILAYARTPVVSRVIWGFDKFMTLGAFLGVILSAYYCFAVAFEIELPSGNKQGWFFLAGVACCSFALRLLTELFASKDKA